MTVTGNKSEGGSVRRASGLGVKCSGMQYAGAPVTTCTFRLSYLFIFYLSFPPTPFPLFRL